MAQSTGHVVLDPDNSPLDVITIVNAIIVPPPNTPVIVNLQSSYDAGFGASTTTGSFIVGTPIVGDNFSDTADANFLSARTRGNNSDNSIGITSTDGALILIGQQALPVNTLSATIDEAVVGFIAQGNDPASLDLAVTSNTAQAYTSFNSNFATIDVIVPTDLDGAGGSYASEFTLNADTAAYFPTDVEQTANFNNASVQVNFGFANGSEVGLGTSSVDGVTIINAFVDDPATDPDTLDGGNFTVDGNRTNALTQGNAADNSIILKTGGASVLEGSAIVSATQLSSDSEAPVIGALPGISASNQDTSIGAVLASETLGAPPTFTFGLPDILVVTNTNVSVDGNSVASNAQINSTRNTIAFDGALDVDNAADEATVETGFADAPDAGSTFVEAFVAAVNNQTAGSILDPGPGSAPQGSVAFTENALIGIGIEDVDGGGVLSLAENTISSSATGQVGSNTIVNNGQIFDVDGTPTDLGVGTGDIAGNFATVNRQLLVHPEISAEVVDSTIVALIGSDETGAAAFGGLVGSSLIVGDDPATADENEGNAFLASATGNTGTSLVDLHGSSFSVGGVGELDTESNEDIADFSSVDSAAGINLTNYQFAHLEETDTSTISALVDNADINVFINVALAGAGSVDAIEVSDSIILVNGNNTTASATLSSYAGEADITALLDFEGTVGLLSYQYANSTVDGQYTVDSEVTGANISVDLGITGAADNLTASVNGNLYRSLTAGNDSSQTLDVLALSMNLDADTLGGDNAIIDDNVSTAGIETRVNDIEASGAFLAVSDQTLRATIAESRVDDVELELFLVADAAGTNSLSGSVLSLSENAAISQVLGNNATNSVSVGANSITAIPDSSSIAGAVSSQSSVSQDDEELSAESSVEAELFNVDLHADIMTTGLVDSVSNVNLNVDDNVLLSLGRANSVSNTVSVTATNLLDASVTTGSFLESTNETNDMSLTVDDSALYILNRQRNEGNDTAALLGPSVSSNVSNVDVSATLDGGVLGTTSVNLSLSGNAIQGAASGNVAGNTINLNVNPETGAPIATGTIDAAAGILNRQGNSGIIEVDMDDGLGSNTITATVNADAAANHDDLIVTVDGNEISGFATGNSALNTINAGGQTLNGTLDAGVGSVFIGPTADVPVGQQIGLVVTDTATGDSNADASVIGNLSILNTQRNYGIPGQDGPDTPNIINSEIENSTIEMNITGDTVDTATSTLSLSSNRLTSQSTANQAVNSISVLPTNALPTAASVLNNQGVQLTNVSAAATDTEMTLNVDGNFDSGTTAVNNNSVLANATLNSATNTVTAQSNVTGSLPGSTIVNYQTSADSSATAVNSGTIIATGSTGGAGGAFSNTNSTLSNNTIGSSATINNSVNKISTPGQTFTRTSSF